MTGFFVRIGAAFAIFTLVLGLGFYALTRFSPSPKEIRPRGLEEQASAAQSGTIGGERMAELLRDTRLYVEQHPDAPAAMKEGRALAPAEFLNEELARSHAKFRVERVEGLKIVLYDVS